MQRPQPPRPFGAPLLEKEGRETAPLFTPLLAEEGWHAKRDEVVRRMGATSNQCNDRNHPAPSGHLSLRRRGEKRHPCLLPSSQRRGGTRSVTGWFAAWGRHQTNATTATTPPLRGTPPWEGGERNRI